MKDQTRPLPVPTPETVHFLEGTRRGELQLQRCVHCDHAYFPPRPFCPKCSGTDVETFAASGRASLYSYVISQRSIPGFDAPYAIAVVQLEEGPRMMTNIIGCAQTLEALRLDMPLEVAFSKQNEEITLPLFKPSEA